MAHLVTVGSPRRRLRYSCWSRTSCSWAWKLVGQKFGIWWRNLDVYMYIYTHIYIYIHVYMYMYTYICICICTCMCMYVYIYIYRWNITIYRFYIYIDIHLYHCLYLYIYIYIYVINKTSYNWGYSAEIDDAHLDPGAFGVLQLQTQLATWALRTSELRMEVWVKYGWNMGEMENFGWGSVGEHFELWS